MNYFAIPGLMQVVSDYSPSKGVVDFIFKITTTHYDIPKSRMAGKCRLKETVSCRHMAFYLLRKHTKLSVTRIGSLLDKDHATVLHAVNKIQDYIDYDVELRALVNHMSKKVEKFVGYHNGGLPEIDNV